VRKTHCKEYSYGKRKNPKRNLPSRNGRSIPVSSATESETMLTSQGLFSISNLAKSSRRGDKKEKGSLKIYHF
jgi:hypothetical protein